MQSTFFRSWNFAAALMVAMVVLLCMLLSLEPARADDSIDPSLIPDGTYPAHVDRVVNDQHLEVTMQGTLRVFLAAARKTITFSDKVKPNDEVAVTLADGKVTAFTKK